MSYGTWLETSEQASLCAWEAVSTLNLALYYGYLAPAWSVSIYLEGKVFNKLCTPKSLWEPQVLSSHSSCV